MAAPWTSATRRDDSVTIIVAINATTGVTTGRREGRPSLSVEFVLNDRSIGGEAKTGHSLPRQEIYFSLSRTFVLYIRCDISRKYFSCKTNYSRE